MSLLWFSELQELEKDEKDMQPVEEEALMKTMTVPSAKRSIAITVKKMMKKMILRHGNIE